MADLADFQPWWDSLTAEQRADLESWGYSPDGSVVCTQPWGQDEYHPNPYDAGSFYQCAHGQPVLKQCPPGLVWNPAANPAPVCDFEVDGKHPNDLIQAWYEHFHQTSKRATLAYSNPYGIAIENKETEGWTEENAALMDAANIRHARFLMKWNHFEPTQGNVDWATLDAAMALAAKHNIDVSWVLYSAPSWAIEPGTNGMWTGTGMADWASRVYARYGGQIKSYELGNEDPFFGETTLGASGANYAQVALPVAVQLRSMGFTGPIIAAGYTNYNSTDDITKFYTDLYQDPSNLGVYLDAHGLHFYHPGDPLVAFPQKPSLDQCISAIAAVAASFKHGNKPTWITETGWITHTDPFHTNQAHVVTEAQQADYFQKVLEYGRNSGGKLAHVDWYTMHPGAEGLSLSQQGKPLQAYYTLKSEIAAYPTWP